MVECVRVCGGGTSVFPETALSSPRNNRRHDSHTVPLQLANCVQHVCGVAASSPPTRPLLHDCVDDKRRRRGLMCVKGRWSEIAITI